MKKKKGARARRKASYTYQVGLHTKASRLAMPTQPVGHTLDHIVPKEFGFKHDIDPALIGSLSNLQWLPYNDNVQKGTRITPQAIEVLRGWGLYALADVYESRLVVLQGGV